MKNALTICVMVFTLCQSAQGGQIEISKSAGFLRVQIEKYPENERRPLLDYLDKGRIAADNAVKLLTAGRMDEFIRDIVETSNSVEQQSKGILDIYGSLISSEYRGQALETEGDVHNLSKAFAATFYAIRSVKRPNEGLYLIIKTKTVDNEHRVFHAQFLEYVGDVPPWLLPQKKQ
ncbi:MAG TPA: hypothetical protein VGH16_18355 [Candidatus Binatia bacterium]|jgi:hypothetical protein